MAQEFLKSKTLVSNQEEAGQVSEHLMLDGLFTSTACVLVFAAVHVLDERSVTRRTDGSIGLEISDGLFAAAKQMTLKKAGEGLSQFWEGFLLWKDLIVADESEERLRRLNDIMQ